MERPRHHRIHSTVHGHGPSRTEVGATTYFMTKRSVVRTPCARANAAAKGRDNAPPPLERLFTFLHQSIDHIKKTVTEKTEKHRKHKQRLIRAIKAADKFLGTHTCPADADSIEDEEERRRRRQEATAHRLEAQEELLCCASSEANRSDGRGIETTKTL